MNLFTTMSATAQKQRAPALVALVFWLVLGAAEAVAVGPNKDIYVAGASDGDFATVKYGPQPAC